MASFRLPIRRLRLDSIIKFFMPVFFMVFVALLALPIQPSNASIRLSLGTATLLAAVMFHVTVTSSIPSTGYLTMADKFMIGTYLIFIANILYSALILNSFTTKQEARALALRKHALIVVPVFTLLVYAIILKGLV